jgi:hypothetical protein
MIIPDAACASRASLLGTQWRQHDDDLHPCAELVGGWRARPTRIVANLFGTRNCTDVACDRWGYSARRTSAAPAHSRAYDTFRIRPGIRNDAAQSFGFWARVSAMNVQQEVHSAVSSWNGYRPFRGISGECYPCARNNL